MKRFVLLAVCLALVGCKSAQPRRTALKLPPPPPGKGVISTAPAIVPSLAFVPTGFVFTSLRLLEDNVYLTWQGKGPYQLQSAATINGPWIDVGTVTTSTDAHVPLSEASAFFRLKQVTDIPGECVWSTNFGGTLLNADSVAPAVIREDQSGNIYVAGAFMGTANFGGASITAVGIQDIFLAKWSGAALQWVKRFGGPNNDYASSMAIDAAGNIIISGVFASPVDFGGTTLTNIDPQQEFVAKYTSNGALIWAKTFRAQHCFGVATDGSNILITGAYGNYGVPANFGGGPLPASGGLGQYNVFVAKLNSAGGHVWSHGYGTTGQNIGYSIAVAPNGDAIVTGAFQNSAAFGGSTFTSHGKSDVFLARYSSTGAHLWSKAFGGTQEDAPKGVAVDSAGNVAITGSFQQTVDFGGGATTSFSNYSPFLVGYSPSGAWAWQRIIGTIYAGVGYGVAYDALGNAVLAGGVQGLADYGNGVYVGGGTANAFVAKYDSTGNYVWSTVRGGAGNGASSVSVSNSVLVTGTFQDGLDLGCGQMTSSGGQQGFGARFNP